MNQAIRAIARADDFTAIRALELLGESIQEHDGYGSRADIVDKLDALTKQSETLAKARDWLGRRADDVLSSQLSVEFARLLLVAFAEREELSDLVRRCVEDYSDERQSVGKTLAVGAIGSLLLALASTSIDYKADNLEVHKKSFASVELVIGQFMLKVGDAPSIK